MPSYLPAIFRVLAQASAAPGSENQDGRGWAGRTATRLLPYALPYAQK